MSVSFNKNGIIQCSGELPNENLLLTQPLLYTPTLYNAYRVSTKHPMEDKTYTVQLWDVDVAHSGKTENTLGVGVYWGGGSIGMKKMIGTNYFTNGHADYLSFVFTPTADNLAHAHAQNSFIYIYNSPASANGTRDMKIGKWKMEYGDTPTFWIPSETDFEENYSYNGIVENGNQMSIFLSHIETKEFIEY